MTTNLFTAIQELVPKLDGWCSPAKAQMLAAAVLTLRPQVSVEIGVFGGRSFLPLALAHKEIGTGILIGIDPWTEHASKQGQLNPEDYKFWATCDHEVVYQRFRNWAVQLGVMDTIRIERKQSDYADPPKVIDFLHLDGNHGPQVENDARRFMPNVRVGGLVFVDDLDWFAGYVRKAEEYMLNSGFVKLYHMDTGGMYQRIA